MPVADDTENRLLEAAGRVFAEKGFRAATVRDICRQAEVNLAAVNYHFGDKEQLYNASLRHAFQCRLRQMPLPEWPAGTPGLTKLRYFIQVIVTTMVEDRLLPWQMQLIMRELTQPQPTAAGEGLVRDFIKPIYEMLWGILREVLPAGLTEQKLHLIAFSIVSQCFYYRVARSVIKLVVGEEEFRTYETALLAEHITQFTLGALGLHVPSNNDSEQP